jgi:hypothetical protein
MREQCDGKACRNDVAEKLQLWLWLGTHVHVGSLTERHSVCMWYQRAIPIRKATGGKRTARNTSMAQRLGDEKCTTAILEFLATTEVGMRGRQRTAEDGSYGGGGSRGRVGS